MHIFKNTLKVDVGESGGAGFGPTGLGVVNLKLLDGVVSNEAAVVIRSAPTDVSGSVLDVLNDRSARRVRTVIDRNLRERVREREID